MSRFVRQCLITTLVIVAFGGSTASGGIAQEAVPAHIHAGTCAALDPEPAHSLADVAPVSVEAEPGAIEVGETSVDVSLDELLASPHAINVHESVENVATYIACGDIAGTVADGTLLIGLHQLNASGYLGVAVLRASDAGTEVSVYLGFGLAGAGEAATPATGSGSDGVATAGAEVEIVIFDYGFDAGMIEITVGTTVTWSNVGQVIHTTTEVDELWDSRILDTGESFSYTFTEAGTYEYLCSLHPSMVGTIVVTEP